MKAKTDLPIFYVYEHWRPDESVCFWVGKGHKKRAWEFRGRNNHHANVIAKLKRSGLFIDVRIIAVDLAESDALKLEIERIIYWRNAGVILCNQTDGGEGVCGLKHSPETRAKLVIARKNRKDGPLSEETKAKISAANTGKKRGPNPKHSAFMTGRVLTPEHKAKISPTGRKLSDETKAKIGAANKGKKRTPEMIRTLSEAHIGYRPSEATRAKRSASLKEAWAAKKSRGERWSTSWQ